MDVIGCTLFGYLIAHWVLTWKDIVQMIWDIRSPGLTRMVLHIFLGRIRSFNPLTHRASWAGGPTIAVEKIIHRSITCPSFTNGSDLFTNPSDPCIVYVPTFYHKNQPNVGVYIYMYMPYMKLMGNHLPFYLIPRMEDDLDDPIEEVHQNVREQNLRKLHWWNRLKAEENPWDFLAIYSDLTRR